MGRGSLFSIVALALWSSGCTCVPSAITDHPMTSQGAGNGQEQEKKGPKTLLDWNLAKDDDKKNSEQKENGKNGEGEEGDKQPDGANGGDKDKDDDDERNRIDPDRPHLPESATTVGLGRAVLESGFTYNTSGGL